MKVSVVIPCYNNYHLIHQALFDLYKHCVKDIDEIIVVDDGSTEEGFQDGLREFWFKQGHLPMKLITIRKNLGFLLASNKGMSVAAGDILILLSNDVRIRENIVKKIVDALDAFPDHLVGGRLLNFDTGWNTFDGRIFPYIEGWLLACTKQLWEKVDGFDERFAPNDYEDIDLSTSVLESGGHLIGLNLNVEHIGAQSYQYSPEREKQTRINQEKFKEKWTK